jgi:uncharacterized protein (DUF1810 family)
MLARDSANHYDQDRFLSAQRAVYDHALAELRAGQADKSDDVVALRGVDCRQRA